MNAEKRAAMQRGLGSKAPEDPAAPASAVGRAEATAAQAAAPPAKPAEPKVYRCVCGWTGQLEHLLEGKLCCNCERQLAGDNEAAEVAAVPGETPEARGFRESTEAARAAEAARIRTAAEAETRSRPPQAE